MGGTAGRARRWPREPARGLALASARLGLVHGLAHPVGSRFDLPHGLVCALFLPGVLAFNEPVAATKYAARPRP